MKTSVNVPDWLRQEAAELNPGVQFGAIIRDALLIALPQWRRKAGQPAAVRALRMELRLRAAQQAAAQQAAHKGSRGPRASRRHAATPTPAPATPPKPRRKRAAASQTTD